MTAPALKSGLWIRALLRRFDAQGRSAMVLRKGDEDAGATLIVLTERSGRTVLLQERREGWKRHDFALPARASASDTSEKPEEYPHDIAARMTEWIARQTEIDPDLWVVELDVPDITEPLETTLDTRRSVF